jgi:2-amino-4-hydroxy-6-hydroxymethyldihydropteridine diphosphokinase
MHKVVTPALSLIKQNLFPGHWSGNARRHIAVVGIGGNVGDVKRRFEHLVAFFHRDRLVSLYQSSPILKNPPFGFEDQDDFHNAVMVLGTDLTPRAFLRHLLHTEKKFGRKRSFKNAPRTLDLDLLFFDDVVMNHKELTLPHPGWSHRDSVRIPLAYLSQA